VLLYAARPNCRLDSLSAIWETSGNCGRNIEVTLPPSECRGWRPAPPTPKNFYVNIRSIGGPPQKKVSFTGPLAPALPFGNRCESPSETAETFGGQPIC